MVLKKGTYGLQRPFGPCGIYAVGGLSETDAEWDTAIVAGFRSFQERFHGPVVSSRRATDRIHLLHVDIGVSLHQVDTRAGTFDLAADARGNAEPLAVGLAEIFDRIVDRAVLLDDRGHDVVDGLEQFGIGVWQPSRHDQNIVCRPLLEKKKNSQENLVALAGDVVDLSLDLFLRRPFIDE